MIEITAKYNISRQKDNRWIIEVYMVINQDNKKGSKVIICKLQYWNTFHPNSLLVCVIKAPVHIVF